MDNLTNKQRDVMHWLERGFEIKNVYRRVCEIKGKVTCNLDTIRALERMNLIVKSGYFSWRKRTS